MRSKQQFYLSPHVASAAMRVHACVNNAPSVTNFLEWPQIGKVTREKRRRTEILKRWSFATKPLGGSSFAAVSNETLACEVTPFVLTAIAPEVRPVSCTFMKPHEARMLRQTVSTMAVLGLSYAAPAEETKSSADAFRGAPATFVLDPPIDALVMFGAGVPNVNLEPGTSRFGPNGSRWTSRYARAEKPRSEISFVTRRFLPLGVKQMLAHEVKLESIRRAERSVHGPGTPPSKNEAQKASVDENKSEAAKRLATALGGLGPTAKTAKKAKKAGSGVSYKYNEGFTNAVRRAVYLRDLC
jgi:chromosome transmission fidelity protein 18